MEGAAADRLGGTRRHRRRGGVLMQPVATPFFFYFLSAMALISGMLVITRRNAVHSALALIVTLLSLAGIYLMLYAPFVAGVQIILYAGGIMVLFLFVIMLVNLERAEKEKQFNKQWLIAIVAAGALGLLFVKVFVESKTVAGLVQKPVAELAETSNTQQVGIALYGNYMLAFEIASLLLLVAIVGAVVMAKKKI
ncbi:MAG TPA: NADH-quinone oxidoreductase subunit J [Terriglobales bacterium]|nr:NADH-quinone oxidoreductase subunit J [Terriglobales bacterium]